MIARRPFPSDEDLVTALSRLPEEDAEWDPSDRDEEWPLAGTDLDDDDSLDSCDSPPSLAEIMGDVEEFVDEVRQGEFAPYAGYDFDLGIEQVFGDSRWELAFGDILDDVDLVFDSGRREEAARAYGPLLHLLDEAERDDLLSWPEGYHFEVDETKARYLRGLYESLPPKERAEPILDVLLGLSAFGETLLTLRDIEEAGGEPLPEIDEFLPLWRRALVERDDPDAEFYILELALEAWIRAGDPADLFEEIRRVAPGHPAVWLGFSFRLARERRREDAMAAAEEGLSRVAVPSIRAELGVRLASMAREAGDPELVLTGLREAFRASGRLDLLRDLLDELQDDPELRDGILGEEAEHRSGEEMDAYLGALLALLAGNPVRAARLASRASSWGWPWPRSDLQITMAALVGAAAGEIPEGSSIAGLWRTCTWYRSGHPKDGFARNAPIEEGSRSLAERMEESLAAHPLDEDGRLRVLAVLRPVVADHVRAVVRRKASAKYPHVAILATALAEALALAGRTTEAKRFHAGLLAEFPRHSAFRRELETALRASPVLR